MTVRQIVAEARQLPSQELAELVDALLAESAEPDPQVDEAWKLEARRRLAEIESGRVKCIPGDQVMAKVRKIVGR
jgi:putative addiction module component (TIGR02574 family)